MSISIGLDKETCPEGILMLDWHICTIDPGMLPGSLKYIINSLLELVQVVKLLRLGYVL